jgi:hypothetical protein
MILSAHKLQTNLPKFNTFSDEMILGLNMFTLIMKHWILAKSNR